MTHRKPTVLFLCSANTCRSQMAEAFLRLHSGNRFEVQSAGITAGPEVHPLAVRVMAEKGIDISSRRPQSVREFLGQGRIDHAVIVCQAAAEACPTFWPGAIERLVWPFPDPAAATGDEEAKLAVFRQVRDDIETRILDWLGTLPPAA
ncbi:MAG: arsenate reductase ArsC [bacterium]